MALSYTTNLASHVTAKAGTTIVSNGLTEWTSQEGNDISFTVPSGKEAPAMNVNQINSVNCPYFNGSDTALRSSANFPGLPDQGVITAQSTVTLFAVLKAPNNQSNAYIWDANSTNNLAAYVHSGFRVRRGSELHTVSMPNNEPFIVRVKYAGNQVSGWDGCRVWIDGTEVSSSNLVDLGSFNQLIFGLRGDNGTFGFGEFTLAEHLIYDEDVSNANAETVEEYLDEEWFTSAPATYTLSTNTTGSGSISRDPDKAEYDEDEGVELTANPDSGWEFSEWTGDLAGSDNPDTVTMNDDKSVTAVFTEEVNTYYTDFSEYTVNQQPSDWTRRGAANFTWEVEEEQGAVGGKIIRGFTESANDRNGLTWDVIDSNPNRDDVEILMRVRFPDSLDEAEILTLSRASGANINDAYRHGARPNQANSKIALEKYVNDTFSNITSTDQITYQTGLWYWVRTRVNGSNHFIKVWPSGEEEPGSWTLTDTDTDITDAGWVGFLRFRTDPVDIDVFSVGVNGEEAPLIEDPGIDFSITNPPHNAVDVPVGVNIEFQDQHDHGFYNVQVSEDDTITDDRLTNLVRDAFIQNKITDFQEPFEFSTQYHAIVRKVVPGGQADDLTLYNETFPYSDQAGWPGWSTQTLSGNGSHKVESNRGVQVVDGSTVVVADLSNKEIGDVLIKLRFRVTDVTSAVQPSYHFRTQDSWLGNNHIEGYYAYWNAERLIFGRVDNGSPSDYQDQELTLSRANNEDVDVWIEAKAPRIRIQAWTGGGGFPGWTGGIDFTPPHQWTTGGFSLKTATQSGASAGSEVQYSLIRYEGAPDVPQLTLDSVTSDTATFSRTSVTFDNGGYEVELDESGTWISIDTDNPFTLSNLDPVQQSARCRAVHNNQPGEPGDSITFTPTGSTVHSVTISPSNPTVNPDSTVQLSASVDVSGGASQDVTWSKQSGVSGLTINSSGLVTASAGTSNNDTAVFRATSTADTNEWGEATVTVVEVAEGSEAGDLQFLKDLYSAMDGDNWDNTQANDKPWNPNATSLPSSTAWYGLTTATRNGERRVIHLDLQRGSHTQPSDGSNDNSSGAGNNLNNADANGDLIPGREFPDPSSLTECEYFNVKHNSIRGPLPYPWNMKKCKRILFEGAWREPDPFGGLNHPNSGPGGGKTTMGTNFWTGSIPGPVPVMPVLEVIEIQQTGVSGQIPSGFASCPELLMMLLNGQYDDNDDTSTMLTGPLPSDLDQGPPKLRYCYIGRNNYNGFELPKLANCTDMKYIRMVDYQIGGGTGFVGSIPTEWGNFDNLRGIQVERNRLTGSFPSFLFPIQSTFDIAHNDLSGDLPASLSVHSQISVLGLLNNNFSGPLRDWMVESRITQMNLDNCGFSGDVPASWLDPMAMAWNGNGTTSTSRIRNLRLNGNNLSGELPHLNWLRPSNFGSATRAFFAGNNFTSASWSMVEDGRESSDTGPIVQKTRRQWYEHFFSQTSF